MMDDLTKSALLAAREALATWCATSAPDECSPENVRAAQERLSEGGTLWYIATVNQKITDALAVHMPGHTDLMVSPESLDQWLDENSP